MTKLEKIDKELSKAREKAAEWQAKIRDLEKQRKEEENSMIVQAVRSLKLTPAELDDTHIIIYKMCLQLNKICHRHTPMAHK